jgi:hypothetical protein
MNNLTGNGNVTVMIVNSIEEAMRSFVPNNVTTFFIDFNDSVMVLRSTDFRGFPSQPRVFKMTEQIMQNQQFNNSQPQVDTSQFATKAEFDELKAVIIQSMNNPQTQQANNQQRNDKRKGGNNS